MAKHLNFAIHFAFFAKSVLKTVIYPYQIGNIADLNRALMPEISPNIHVIWDSNDQITWDSTDYVGFNTTLRYILTSSGNRKA